MIRQWFELAIKQSPLYSSPALRALYASYALRKKDSALSKLGWFRSVKEHRPIDGSGAPLPWIAYPAISFLAKRVRSDMKVFEFGSGASTFWWAQQVERIVSVEHDASWHARVRSGAPPNAELRLVPLAPDGAYSRAAADSGERYHVIVIDGRDRFACARHSVQALTDDGAFVWDNSEREAYRAGIEHLLDLGFRRIEFEGLAPTSALLTETSIFYRPGNCLGI